MTEGTTQVEATPSAGRQGYTTDGRTRVVTWQDPAAAAGAGLAMAGLDYLRAMTAEELPGPPIALLLGIFPRSIEPGRVVFEMEAGEHLYNPIGLVHGGAIGTLLDSAAGCAVHSVLPAGTGWATTSLTLSFIRPAAVASGTIVATGETLHVGGRVAHAQARATDAAGKLLATAQVTCAVLR